MRLAHSRFMNGSPVCKGEDFNKVVSTAWSFDETSGVLTYGATVFKQRDCNDYWNRQDHKNRAVERFKNNPIRVILKGCKNMQELSNISIDWFIAVKLIFKFGTHNKNEVDVRRVHGDFELPQDFNSRYSLERRFEELTNRSLDMEFTEFERGCKDCFNLFLGFAVSTVTFFGLSYVSYSYNLF